jgi:asparagine synthase (glutamine-hydrolysing)
MIEHTKVDPYYVYPKLQDVFVLTPDIIWHQDEPYQSQSAFLSYNVHNLANNNKIKVLLNSQGADEFMGRYGQFTFPSYADMLIHLKIPALISEIKNRKKNKELFKFDTFFEHCFMYYANLYHKKNRENKK